jgi:hypothetical protein
MFNNWYTSNIRVLSACELNPKLLHDLHHGEPMDKITHIQKMSLPTLNGGLWGNFTSIYWVLKYLQCPIHIWNTNSYRIMMKVGNENSSHVLNILYANNHFEHVITCDPMIKFSNIHTCDAYVTQIFKIIISIMKIMRLNINEKNKIMN